MARIEAPPREARTEPQPPYGAYAAITGVFAGGLGVEQAIGELVTCCSRCVGTWAAAGLAVTQILALRFGRLLTWSLASAGINDFLQAGFAELTSKANELDQRSPG